MLPVLLTGLLAANAAGPGDPALAKRLASGALRWGGDAEGGAPYVLRDPQKGVIGFEVELAAAVAEELGRAAGIPVRAEFVQYEWVSLIPGLAESRDFDMALNGLEITPERRAVVRFSRPYYIYGQQIVVRKGDERVSRIEDLRGLSVGTLSGSASEETLKGAGVERIVGFDGQVEPYLDLEHGRLDAVLLDTPIVVYYGASNPKLQTAGAPFALGEYGMAFRKDDEVLAAAVNRALSSLMRSGKLAALYRKWNLLGPEQARLAAGEHRAEELAGLGLADAAAEAPALAPAESVDPQLVARSAGSWGLAQYAPVLLRAAGMTVFLSVAAMALAMLLGLVVCVTRLYAPGPLRVLAAGYVEFFRGTPLLLLLFFLYFGLSSAGFHLPAVATAILAFGINYGAYEAEIYRSAILSVPSGQWQAGRALGMGEGSVFRRVILPQAFRTALGPITNDFVAMLKDTSLVSVIAVRELTKEYLILARSTLKFVEIGLLTAALYLLMSVPLGLLSRRLERIFGAPR